MNASGLIFSGLRTSRRKRICLTRRGPSISVDLFSASRRDPDSPPLGGFAGAFSAPADAWIREGIIVRELASSSVRPRQLTAPHRFCRLLLG
ncbi:unnamed protein product [Urochloa humidicola]